jgi:iron complex transport system ATP-binding protein
MELESKKILILDSLTIGYKSGKKERAVMSSLNESAYKGELIAVIGRNGIGKSTLLRTIAGLQPALSGDVYFDGKRIREYTKTDLAQKVGYISTEIIKVTNMKVYDLVALGRFPHTNWFGRLDEENHFAIMNAIDKTSLSEFTDRNISELSDGERQRTMIARILAQDTGIMVMDEPTAFLDIGSKYEILHLMHQLSANNKKTIVFSTHDLHMAASLADKIWLILEDKIISGAPEDLLVNGSFDHLFDSFPVQYNSESGTFSLKTENKGKIFVEGDGLLKHWTEKALNRAGFAISDVKTEPHIIVPSHERKNWNVFYNNVLLEFGSIYELMRWLNDELKNLTLDHISGNY